VLIILLPVADFICMGIGLAICRSIIESRSVAINRANMGAMIATTRSSAGSTAKRHPALGRGLISAEPYSDRSELHEGEVVGGKFVVTRRHPTTLLDPVEEPLNPIAGAI
jgi:hypothetical protein